MMLHSCVAVSTASGKSGIAVIRISGEDAIEIASHVFVPRCGKPFAEAKSRYAVYGDFVDFTKGNFVFDNGLALIFRAPHSFTGEDTVELNCHGSPVAVSQILALLYHYGAKPALPGEFTRRAFINGKMDLTQAEAVGSLLDAESVTALAVSNAEQNGTLGKEIRDISEEILSLLSQVYVTIDYPDEDMSDITDDEMTDRLRKAERRLSALEGSYASGVAVTKGVNTVIVGCPNAGKSTFFNMLAGFDRAIVTSVAGTTRDVVTESVIVSGVKLNLSDTAGIRETADEVEKIGVERSESALSASELVFALFDASRALSPEDEALAKKALEKKTPAHTVAVLNKCDAAATDTIAEDIAFLRGIGYAHIIQTSAKDGVGREHVEQLVSKLYALDISRLAEGKILLNARQHTAVQSALLSVKSALSAMKNLSRDMAGLDLESALQALNEADGRNVSEQVVNEIFSHFCVGK